MSKKRIEPQLNPRPQSRCVVCGADNPRGLQICFEAGPDGVVRADWKISPDWEGFEGLIHGGIISTVLDEAMSKAVVAKRWRALTSELRVRYRQKVASGETLSIQGWVVEKNRRMILTEASLCAPSGEERAHAWATFLVVS